MNGMERKFNNQSNFYESSVEFNFCTGSYPVRILNISSRFHTGTLFVAGLKEFR